MEQIADSASFDSHKSIKSLLYFNSLDFIKLLAIFCIVFGHYQQFLGV